jgi:hypothetical protein
MLIVISALDGYVAEASDGPIGTVQDVLFDDRTWTVRWLVVDAGTWLTDRKLLIHPSAIGKPNHDRGRLPLAMTKAQVEASPPIAEHAPVSRQMEWRLYRYYGSDPLWGNSYFGAGGLAAPLSEPGFPGGDAGVASALGEHDDSDPHLRSAAEVKGYHIHASDGEIGHAENLLVDDAAWSIRYLIVDTQNWWPGRHVLIAPYAVQAVSWSDREIRLGLDRRTVETSPPWDPIAMIDQVYQKTLHKHYGWSGYGF